MMPNATKNGLFIGLMSGTSLDGIDCVICDINPAGIELKHSLLVDWPADLKLELQQIIDQSDSLDQMLVADQRCAAVYASACNKILQNNDIQPDSIIAIGSHGQTIRHNPDSDFGYSCQIGSGSRIAELTGITTITDFRNRDIAAHGQGAPLAPAFHQAVFPADEKNRAVVNIGGIANVTLINGEGISGYDTGPGNRLLDDWIHHCHGKSYDKDGNFAASGLVNQELLKNLLSDAYFQKTAPKSTGSDYFNLDWLKQRLKPFESLKEADIQATLAELTAASIANEVTKQTKQYEEVLICGGGWHNKDLLNRLKSYLPNSEIASSGKYGIDPDWMEAMAFAWLGWRTINGFSGNLPEVTGAIGLRICGAIYPA